VSRKRRWRFTRAFKLAVLERMEETANIVVLAEELGIQRKLLYTWREKYAAGGPEALNASGRPQVEPVSAMATRAVAPVDDATRARQRVAELERKSLSSGLTRGLANSNWNWTFFAQPCSGSGHDAGRTADLARQHLRSDPGDDAVARRYRDRADVRAGRRQPCWVLPALARLGAAPGGDGVAR
jgi:transposase-like protein